jgi:hypothetical protein
VCTVSWLHQPGGYHLLCNRDEKRSRGIADPPRLFERGGADYIAPIDADFGGTWIAVNEHGISLCLLNGRSGRGTQSRGLIIPDLIWSRSIDDCAFLLRQSDLSPFAPFTLLMLEPGQPAAVAAWDGMCLTLDPDARAPLTSSSYDPDGVRRERLREFARLKPADLASLRRFHTSHAGSSGAHAACMHRPDAETVSFSEVNVRDGRIRFHYLPAAPCARDA